MATITDVAREAGVGIGTVSRVLNDSPLVSLATRQRVVEAIERLGYQPSPIARAFGRRRTAKLEVLLPAFAHTVVLDLILGIQDGLADSDYTMLLRSVDHGDDGDRVFDECCQRTRADGVLAVWMPPTDAFVDRLLAANVPAVLVNAQHPRLSSVGVDHDLAAQQAVAHCARLGHRRMGLIDRRRDPFDGFSPGLLRAGYERALAALGLGIPDGYARLAEPAAAAAATATNELLGLAEPPTAILAAGVSLAVGTLESARASGRRVPQDVSVVGYNETPLTRDLGMTTVRVPLRDLARIGTEMLLASIAESDAAPEVRCLPTELVVRRTCAPPSVR